MYKQQFGLCNQAAYAPFRPYCAAGNEAGAQWEYFDDIDVSHLLFGSRAALFLGG